MTGAGSESDIDRVARLAAHLPAVEIAGWHGTPSLKVAGKSFVRSKEPGVLVVMCPLGLKEALIEADPDRYFETPHYSGWPALLVRMDRVDDETLRDRIEYAWREKASRKLLRDVATMAEEDEA